MQSGENVLGGNRTPENDFIYEKLEPKQTPKQNLPAVGADMNLMFSLAIGLAVFLLLTYIFIWRDHGRNKSRI